MGQKELYTFYVQVCISASMSLFCMFNLTFKVGSKGNEALYASLLSGVFGYWLPSPAGSSKSSGAVEIDSQKTTVVAKGEKDND